jgi:hypothetical protein
MLSLTKIYVVTVCYRDPTEYLIPSAVGKTLGGPASLPKTAALTKAPAERKAWLKEHGIKVTKNTIHT